MTVRNINLLVRHEEIDGMCGTHTKVSRVELKRFLTDLTDPRCTFVQLVDHDEGSMCLISIRKIIRIDYDDPDSVEQENSASPEERAHG